MARGWESKSIEEQQAEAAASSTAKYSAATPEERDRRRRIEGLRLSRARIAQQLGATTDERYSKQLQQALADLDRQIEEDQA